MNLSINNLKSVIFPNMRPMLNFTCNLLTVTVNFIPEKIISALMFHIYNQVYLFHHKNAKVINIDIGDPT